jgi:hypothetical protein
VAYVWEKIRTRFPAKVFASSVLPLVFLLDDRLAPLVGPLAAIVTIALFAYAASAVGLAMIKDKRTDSKRMKLSEHPHPLRLIGATDQRRFREILTSA